MTAEAAQVRDVEDLVDVAGTVVATGMTLSNGTFDEVLHRYRADRAR